MPEREGFPPPEAIIPPTAESPGLEAVPDRPLSPEAEVVPSADQVEAIKHGGRSDDRGLREGEHRPEDEWDTEGKRTEVLREYTRGLGDLYDLLPHTAQIDKRDVLELVDHTDLRMLWPAPREDLAGAVVKEGLHERRKADFLARGLEVLREVIEMEAIKRAGDEWLDEQLARRAAPPTPPVRHET